MWTDKDISYRHLKVFERLGYVHIAKERRGTSDPKTQPSIFLGYGDDEFNYRVWNLTEKKLIQSHNIIVMVEKNIVDWESEKKTSSSESTDEDRLDGLRIHPVGSQMSFEDHSGPVRFGQETRSTEEEPGAETRQDPESDSNEEPTEEPVVENKEGDTL